jgi:hypothetical protein
MQQLNAYRFYELGAKLHGLFGTPGQNRVTDIFAPLTEAQALLDGLIKGDTLSLQTSKTDAVRLLNKIGALFNRYFIDPSTKQLKSSAGEDRIDPHEISLIQSLVEKFEHALAAELNRVPTYVAGRHGIYSTYDLAEDASAMFSDTLRAYISSAAQLEFASAGRALAFDMGTATAVHTLRAIEIVLKSYYECFASPVSAKNERTYAVYLKKLAALAEEEDKTPRPDKRVIQLLAQIKDHYRNPLLMPESTVSVDSATQLFGMASALISLMAEQIAAQGVKSEGKSKLTAALDEDEDEAFDFRTAQVG